MTNLVFTNNPTYLWEILNQKAMFYFLVLKILWYCRGLINRATIKQKMFHIKVETPKIMKYDLIFNGN